MNPEAEVSDPMEAAKLQLEMMEMRVRTALFALTRGLKHQFAEQLKAINSHAMSLNHLAYERGTPSDRRLVDLFHKSAYETSHSAVLSTTPGAIYLEGSFDINELAKRIVW
jgi:hypothetical protein